MLCQAREKNSHVQQFTISDLAGSLLQSRFSVVTQRREERCVTTLKRLCSRLPGGLEQMGR